MIRKIFQNNIYLFYICSAAFLLRILSIFFLVDLEDPEMWEFGLIARNMLSGLGFSYKAITLIVPSAYMPPGLPYIYYFLFLLFGDNTVSYIIILFINSILSVISIIIIYKLAQQIYNNILVSFLSASYAALSPIFIFSAVNFNSIIIYHVLIGLIYLLFLKLQKSDKAGIQTIVKYSIMLGITLGIFLYFRAEGTALLAIITIYLLFKKKIKTSLIVFIIAVIVISPWTIRNYIVFHKIIPVTTSMGYNFYIGHSDSKTDTLLDKKVSALKEDSEYEIKRSEYGIDEAINYIKNNPGNEFDESLAKLYSLWVIDKYRELARHPVYIVTWLITLALFLYGYYLSMRVKENRRILLFLNIYLIFSTLLVLLFFNIPRYQIQMSFIMIPIGMFGLYNLLLKFNLPLNKFTPDENQTKKAV